MKGFQSAVRKLRVYTEAFGYALGLLIMVTFVEVGISKSHVATAGEGQIGAIPTAAVHRIKDAAPAADDTGRNVRDRDNQTMTPSDQSNDPEDVNVTREIRKALVADDSLSTLAKNIKIITVHGKVILRGPIANIQEKAVIGQKAQKFTKQTIDNQLEVTSQ